MTRPSLVRLDSQNRPVGSVLEGLGTQSGLTLKMDSSVHQELAAVREPAPVTLWTALDRLGLKSVYHQNPGKGKYPELNLHRDLMWPFTSIAGPFRVSLTGLHLHRDRQLIRGPWVQIDRFGQRIEIAAEDLKGESVTYFGGLDVMVEPRMWFTQEAHARLTEASDDLGQSLVPEIIGPEPRLATTRTSRSTAAPA